MILTLLALLISFISLRNALSSNCNRQQQQVPPTSRDGWLHKIMSPDPLTDMSDFAAQMPNLSGPALSPFSTPALLTAYVLTVSELVMDALTLSLTLLNLYAITSTSVLHVNMKILLLTQSLGIQLLSTGRMLQLCVVLVTGALFANPVMLLDLAKVIGICMNGLVGYLLVIERIVATVRVKTYEQRSGAALGIGFFLFTVCVKGVFIKMALLGHTRCHVDGFRSPPPWQSRFRRCSRRAPRRSAITASTTTTCRSAA